MELGSIMEFLNNNPFWSLVQLDFLQRVLSPLKRNLFPQDLRIYDFVRLIFVEKILRVQPKVKKLYLLLRAVDTKSAEERLHN
ncbi:hypothetical protein NC652_041337 [Populus alba x Populus x berolinensis]|uniref:Thioester reductase (TE) domain-containing protein n=1 Tax=Populus tomentosa TaxID=118781 RepID=A0A8X7XUH9_POPTO|nr:hypothetical protein POTOM_058358 [Populus tomentosa]KAJ6858999.1 hypothetical protein NC652_041335 [Populus alba x Populus x berolinensis]KAJ6859001.1 hypothetical protein NC652_041337 [Populus alba x Populus x berolinensis]